MGRAELSARNGTLIPAHRLPTVLALTRTPQVITSSTAPNPVPIAQ
jgi:hypothetical protein